MASRTRSASRAPRAGAASDPDAVPWVVDGLLAGVAGAAAIALFFAGIDLAAGRPLWTPFALGSALFLGVTPAPDVPISPALVGGYTVIHGWVFVSVALIAAFLLVGARVPGRGRLAQTLVVAAALFVAFTAIFAAFAALLAAAPHGSDRILAANAIAALAMAAVLVARRERLL